jgi:hypothetical protein
LVTVTLHDAPAEAPLANGNSAATPPLRPASGKGTSIRLAMIVPAFGLAILIIFIVAEALSPPTAQLANLKPVTIVAGGLHGVAGASSLRSITVSDQPPSNIVAAVSIPTGSLVVSHQNNTAAVGQYDAQVSLRVAATQGALETFFAAAMKKQGWQVYSQGPASHNPGAFEVLGKQAGLDGHYWEMGAIVSATTFPPGGSPTGETQYTVRLFQDSDLS